MNEPRPDSRRLADSIAQTEREQVRARERHRSLWVQVSQVGVLGWLLALPIVAGALLGHWIDRRLGTGISFALGMLLFGVGLAGFALWRQLRTLDQD